MKFNRLEFEMPSCSNKFTGTNETALDWSSRLKIAIGTARGLRYLHEDCRVGCIVHRDLRPKNILLTHDFEPLVSFTGGFSQACLLFQLFERHSRYSLDTYLLQ